MPRYTATVRKEVDASNPLDAALSLVNSLKTRRIGVSVRDEVAHRSVEVTVPKSAYSTAGSAKFCAAASSAVDQERLRNQAESIRLLQKDVDNLREWNRRFAGEIASMSVDKSKLVNENKNLTRLKNALADENAKLRDLIKDLRTELSGPGRGCQCRTQNRSDYMFTTDPASRYAAVVAFVRPGRRNDCVVRVYRLP